MTEHNYANYRLLAGAIVEEQCREYHEQYLRYLKKPTEHRQKIVRNARRMLTEHSYGLYLNLDMEAIVKEIEKKAQAGEKIRWKGNYGCR